MSTEAKMLVLKGPGINCEDESARLVRRSGGQADIVHIGQLERGAVRLNGYQGLFIPGGFSEGDAVRAGIVLALQLKKNGLGDQVAEFVQNGKPVLGICNGFQVLVNMGILPGDGEPWQQTASLTTNASGEFESRWVDLRTNPNSVSPFVSVDLNPTISLPIANGEGRLVASQATLDRLQANGQVLLQYANAANNPSRSMQDIAAISNPAGNVMGSMPHIERLQHPLHDPLREMPAYGEMIMRSILEYARGA